MIRRLVLTVLLVFLGVVTSCADNLLTKHFHRTVDEYFSDEDVRHLAEAAAWGDERTIENLVAKGVKIDSQGTGRVTPLAWAVGAQNLVGVKKLLELGANPNRSYEEFTCILNTAVGAGNLPQFELLLQGGGDPNWRDDSTQAAIELTILGEDDQFLRLALQYGKNPNPIEDVGNLLERSVIISRFDKTLLLLKAGADVRLASERARNAIGREMEKMRHSYGTDPAFISCLKIFRKQGLVLPTEQ